MKLLRILIMALLAAWTIGCVRVEQTITMKPDGSGSFVVTYGMSEQTVRQMEAMQAMTPAEEREGNLFEFNEQELREQLKAFEEHGLKVRDISSELKDGWRYMKVALDYASMSALAKTDFFKDSNMKLTREGDRYTLEMKGAEADGAEDMNPEMLAQMAPMFAGMRIALHINAPGRIVEHNATEVTGQKASWVFDVDQDPTAVAKMQKMHIRLVFEGADIELPTISN